jgi:ribosomal protein L16 Arg81 hydroxylase
MCVSKLFLTTLYIIKYFWRFDDVMISYATTGGSVGPHFDYYDVFL